VDSFSNGVVDVRCEAQAEELIGVVTTDTTTERVNLFFILIIRLCSHWYWHQTQRTNDKEEEKYVNSYRCIGKYC
jgi:hypothetical protein